jgi:UDP-glucose 4-epimerase
MGTTCILEAIQNSTVKRFIYASTMYVYSSYGSFYRASKQAAETLIEAYSENCDLEFTLLRYGSLYGPRAQDWNGLRGYVKQVVEEGKLRYDGSGRERREYIHVKDAARLSVDVLEDWKKNSAITVTGTQVMTSGEIIEMIFEISGKSPNIEYIEGQKNDYHYTMTPYRYTPKKARKLVPSEFVDIGEGILEIVEDISFQREIEATTNLTP